VIDDGSAVGVGQPLGVAEPARIAGRAAMIDVAAIEMRVR
jgi:hypothetical protein